VIATGNLSIMTVARHWPRPRHMAQARHMAQPFARSCKDYLGRCRIFRHLSVSVTGVAVRLNGVLHRGGDTPAPKRAKSQVLLHRGRFCIVRAPSSSEYLRPDAISSSALY